jgi:hypothetical protein
MSQSGHFSSLSHRPRKQRGQASAEYLVATAAILTALMWIVWGNPDSPSDPYLIGSLKSFFGAYSFALSLP